MITEGKGRVGGRKWALLSLTLAALACSSDGPLEPSFPELAEPIAEPRIAFTSTRDGARWIYVSNADGTEVGRLAKGHSPAWSRNGDKIAYLAPDERIHVMNPDGSGQTALREGYDPTWTPDGRIVFTDRASGIIVMNADGSNATPLTERPSFNGGNPFIAPATSADGLIMFFQDSYDCWCGQEYGPWHAYLANADGSDLRQVSWLEQAANWLPQVAFSPDGTRVAFNAWGIATARVDGSEYQQILHDPRYGTQADPYWSPDGAKLLFVAESRIHLVTLADGSSRQFIPEAVAPAFPRYTDSEPVWVH